MATDDLRFAQAMRQKTASVAFASICMAPGRRCSVAPAPFPRAVRHLLVVIKTFMIPAIRLLLIFALLFLRYFCRQQEPTAGLF